MSEPTTTPVTAEEAGHCQYPTRLDDYGLPASTCGAPAVEHRPDRMVVRAVCEDHRNAMAYTSLLDELERTAGQYGRDYIAEGRRAR